MVPVPTLIWLNGVPATSLPLPDRGFSFGDGLFETLLLQRGRPLFLDQHLQRLNNGLSALALPDCAQEAARQIERAANAILQAKWEWSVLRLTVSRGSAPRGYAPVTPPAIRIVIEAQALDRDCLEMLPPASLCIADIRLSSQPKLSGIKHLNRLEQVLAAAYGKEMEVDECLMLDQSDNVISVVAGNLFIVCGGELLTPDITACGVAGTRRRLIIDRWGPAIGLNVCERPLSLTDLEVAEEVFFCNSLLGVRPVATLEDLRWVNHTVCSELMQCIRDDAT